MSAGYSHTTRAVGTTLTANIYNADHVNHITNGIPAQFDDYSQNLGEMQTTTDPYPGSVASLATTLAGEIERIRFILAQITGKSNWYEDPDTFLTTAAIDTSAKLAAIVGDETGTGLLVFNTSPTLVTPALGTPSALVGTNISGTAASLTAGLVSSITGLVADTVATITGLAPDTATTQAVQAAITTIANQTITGTLVTGDATAIVSAATTSLAGKSELATNAEVETGTDTVRTMTPSNVPSIKAILQNSQSAAYTTVLADAGKHIYHPGADTTARIWTIDSNANVAYPLGTAITFVNDTSGGVITISITSDTLVLAPDGTTGSRTLAADGMATAIKITANRWMISGSGLT